jgi:hypothetical protein
MQKQVACNDEVVFHQIHIWSPYNVYMNDLATKIVTILMTSCILPHGTYIVYVAHRFKHRLK